MKIYTKTGDAGTTSLVGGERVSKCSQRVMAYGDVDELVSWLGVLRSEVSEKTGADLRRIQVDLMVVSSHFAAGRVIPKLKNLDPAEVDFLEHAVDELSASIPVQNTFLIPCGPKPAADCHVARTVCRRAERSAVAMPGITEQDSLGIKFLNRLSDFLYTLARYLQVSSGVPEDKWVP